MGREKILFKNNEKKSRHEVFLILRQIADKIEQGNLTLKQGTESLHINFPADMTLEIKFEEELKQKTKHSLEIELEWIVGDHGQDSMVIG